MDSSDDYAVLHPDEAMEPTLQSIIDQKRCALRARPEQLQRNDARVSTETFSHFEQIQLKMGLRRRVEPPHSSKP